MTPPARCCPGTAALADLICPALRPCLWRWPVAVVYLPRQPTAGGIANRLGFGQGRRCVLPGAHRGEAAATSRKTTAAQLPEWSSCHGGWSARRTLHYLPAAVIRTQGRAGRALRARRVAAHRGHGSGRGPDLMATLIGSVSYDGLARTNSPHSGRPARSADDSSTFADLPGSATSPTTAPDPYWRSEGPNTNHTLVCGEPITALTMLDFGGHT